MVDDLVTRFFKHILDSIPIRFFFCFLPSVLFRHHTILFSLCFGEGTFSLSIFYFLKREFSFFCSPFVCMQGVFSLFFYRERTCDAYMYNNIGEVLLYDCKTFLFAATQSKERQEHFFHLVILHVVVRELFFHNKIFYL